MIRWGILPYQALRLTYAWAMLQLGKLSAKTMQHGFVHNSAPQW
jgi:hypothetical protein